MFDFLPRPVSRPAVAGTLALLLCPIGGGAAVAHAANTAQGLRTAKLVASDAAHYEFFGSNVALSGATALVSAPGHDRDVGTAYVFQRGPAGTWSQVAELTANDVTRFDGFGYSISLNNATALVSAPYEKRGTGAVYVFQRDQSGTWSQVAKLTASDGAPGDYFGISVSVSGATALVSAPPENNGTGVVYVFQRDQSGTWGQVAELTVSDAGQAAAFGYKVSLSGNTALIGSPFTNRYAGVAYVFQRDQRGTWSQVAELTASDATPDSYFGNSVAISGDTALLGAGAKNNITGAAYVFQRDQSGRWSQVAELTAGDAFEGDAFGYSVSVSGGTVLVGAFPQNSTPGAAYVFRRTRAGTWGQVAKLTVSDHTRNDQFGSSVAVSGATALVGDAGNDKGTGAAYLFGPLHSH